MQKKNDSAIISSVSRCETFEFLPKLGKSSFLRIPDRGPGLAQESSHLRGFVDSRFRGNDKDGRFSKLSRRSYESEVEKG